MRSRTGYGRGETDHNGTKFSVELNSVNRKQSDIVINLPRDLAALEPQIRQTINENISRGRTNVVVSYHNGSGGPRKLALDTELARSYHDAMCALQKDLDVPGEITIGSILQAPGVMRTPEETIDSSAAWPAIERALRAALAELIKMRARRQASGQRFDPAPESHAQTDQRDSRAPSGGREKISRRAARTNPKGRLADFDRRRAFGKRNLLLCRSRGRIRRTHARRKPSRSVCSSSSPARAGRSHAGIHHSGNFSRTEYARSQGERCCDFAACRRLQSGVGKNPRTNSKS